MGTILPGVEEADAAFLLFGIVVNLASTKWGEIDDVASYAAWLAVGCMLVGFSEELLTRGLAIVGGRGSMHEKWGSRSSSRNTPPSS